MRWHDGRAPDAGCAPWPDAPVAACELHCTPTFRAGYSLMEHLAGAPGRPDALLFGSDMVAVAALQYCLAHGLRPRADIGLCGFDGIALTTVVQPGLTTLDFPYERVIAEGARRIAASIDTPESVPGDLLIPVQVLPRETT
jgi:LacI family transcriptional regulator